MNKKIDCILLIDDNADDNAFNQIIIEKTNAADQVKVAQNGEEALQILAEQSSAQPDLILLDLNMPKMNGWEFLEAYKALYPESNSPSKLVVLATSLSEDDLKKLNRLPGVASNIKPLTSKMLSSILENHSGTSVIEQQMPAENTLAREASG